MVRWEPTKVCGRNASSAFPQNSTGFTAKYFDRSAVYQVAASLVQDLSCMRDSWPLCHRKGRIGFWFYSASTQPRGHSQDNWLSKLPVLDISPLKFPFFILIPSSLDLCYMLSSSSLSKCFLEVIYTLVRILASNSALPVAFSVHFFTVW